ncbi:MAG: glycosyltransferase [Gammaproteobacteria bacterium]
MAARQLTVMQILPALESGGVERGTLEVAEALVEAGHRSIVVSSGGRLVEQLVEGGSEHIRMPVGRKSPAMLLQVLPLREILLKEQVDIVHARSRIPAWIAWMAWFSMHSSQRPRFITTVHGLYSVKRYSAIMMRGERIIAVSDTARKYILNNYPAVDSRRVVTIYRGVDSGEFPYNFRPDEAWRESWYREYPFLLDRKVLTLPGRLTRLKGHEDFIRLIAVLVARGLDVHGLIVGHLDPKRRKYIDELRTMIAERSLENRITFTGQRSDMKNIYACSNVVLSLSSKPESFGRTVAEAISLGVPVVGYGDGGVGEILDRYYPAGSVSAGDADQLAAKIMAILGGPERITRQEVFTRQAMLEQLLQLYQEQAPSHR